MEITSLKPCMASFRTIVQCYSANPKTVERKVLRVTTVFLLSCFDVERGVADGQADTCRIRKALNMRLTGIVQCQAQVPGQDHQVRRKTTGLFRAVIRQSMENVERRIRDAGVLACSP